VDYSASLDYLYGLQLFGVKLGLENMQALKARLPLLQSPLPCVHVAGTNGKGSVSVLLAEILKRSGMRVGLYTSPHLHCFTERIRINGEPISRDEMTSLAEEIRLAAEGIPVTFFEATTAMALLAFRKHQVDFAVIETGLGGRLDATNIVEPQLCAITPISYDHGEYLGESITEIAAEKAGIIKPGVPVVVGRQSSEVTDVLERFAERNKAAVCLAGRDFSWSLGHDGISVTVDDYLINGLSCALAGEHQRDNLAQAVAASLLLRQQGLPVTDEAIREAGKMVEWPGRLEWVGNDSAVLLDTSHNRAGIECLAAYLAGQGITKIHLVVGLSGVRSPSEVLKPLVNCAVAVYAVPVLFGTTVPTTDIVSWSQREGIPVSEFITASDGLAEAMLRVGKNETVVVTGSLYLVAELRQKLLMTVDPFRVE